MVDKNYLRVFPYTDSDAELWDKFIAEAPMATFLHTRRYLSYHADRFQDVSLLIKDERSQLIGLFLAAVDPINSKRVVSHPGITYGGVLHTGHLLGEQMIQAFKIVLEYYKNREFEQLRYKAIPYIYHQYPLADDLYALFHLGAVRYRCDLSCAIDLTNRREPSQRRQRSLKKALKQGIKVKEGAEDIGNLWLLIEENLARKMGQLPVHSLDEITYLHSLFPKNINFYIAISNSEIVAGVVLFSISTVVRTQYIASSLIGYDLSALDAIFELCIEKAKTKGSRYFDFGTSNQNEGKSLAASLYKFKSEFGGSGVLHEFYEMTLK
ncbi:GNAT family N-acetyltransferase [Nostoc sp. DedVER01b]|uniref:GNAT family N-acetyltransferase n=1 Tax=Nostoc sp. DedVER01b TaxID=3075404 RepID=UPI002AD1FB64|nr:GNAT family N-acetyltransferase [Nostoc sp. DedVER01b]MDZ8113825.1 GNAT family N-acetyltransferase [Nostoc sp. DedVER01b]